MKATGTENLVNWFSKTIDNYGEVIIEEAPLKIYTDVSGTNYVQRMILPSTKEDINIIKLERIGDTMR